MKPFTQWERGQIEMGFAKTFLVAKLLGVCAKTAAARMESGKIKSYKVRSGVKQFNYVVDGPDLLNYFKENNLEPHPVVVEMANNYEKLARSNAG